MNKNNESRVWIVALMVVGAIAVWFLLPQLGTAVLAALMAFLFYPLYKKLKSKKAKSKGNLAAFATLLISFLVIILPLLFVAVSAISQLAVFADSVSTENYWQDTPQFVDWAIGITNDILEPITGQRPSITETSTMDFLRNTIPSVLRGGASMLVGVITSLPQVGIALVVYIYLFLAFLKYGPQLIEKVKVISPFSKSITNHYIEKIGLMTNAMVKGQLILSMITALFASSLLAFLGYGHLFFILFVLFTILNFVPLGSGIVLVPMALISMFDGQFIPGLLVIILYYAFGNLEPLWRTKLIPKKIQLPVAVTMLATFCGIAYFGILGIVYGPVIMILIITTVNLFVEFKQKTKISDKKLES